MLHALTLAPTGNGFNEGVNDLGIIDKVDVAEAGFLLV